MPIRGSTSEAGMYCNVNVVYGLDNPKGLSNLLNP